MGSVVIADETEINSLNDDLELYEDLVTNHIKEGPNKDSLGTNSRTFYSSKLPSGIPENYDGKKFPLIVSNLQWWTSDRDLADAVGTLGVHDLMEIKFFENKANGQSKGIAVLTLQKEESLNNLMEALPKTNLNGKTPTTALCTKKNLEHYKSLCGLEGDTRKKEERKPDVVYNQVNGGFIAADRLPNPLYNMVNYPQNLFNGVNDSYGQQARSVETNVANKPASPLNSKRSHVNGAELEKMIKKNWEVTNNAIRSSKSNADNGCYETANQILHTAASMIRKSLVSCDLRCQDMIDKLEIAYKEVNEEFNSSRKRSRSRDKKYSSRKSRSRSGKSSHRSSSKRKKRNSSRETSKSRRS